MMDIGGAMKQSITYIFRVAIIAILASGMPAHARHQRMYKVAAGILPCAFDKNGTAYFLLGQEPNGEWADFGGHAERGDRNAKMTAIREFSEETRCVFSMHSHAKRSKRIATYPTCMKMSNRYIAHRMSQPLIHPRG